MLALLQEFVPHGEEATRTDVAHGWDRPVLLQERLQDSRSHATLLVDGINPPRVGREELKNLLLRDAVGHLTGYGSDNVEVLVRLQECSECRLVVDRQRFAGNPDDV